VIITSSGYGWLWNLADWCGSAGFDATVPAMRALTHHGGRWLQFLLLAMLLVGLVAPVTYVANQAAASGDSRALPTSEPDRPTFHAEVSRLDRATRRGMRPAVWRKGCPVPLRKLRTVQVSHWDFVGDVQTGTLVVHRRAVRDVKGIMAELFELDFPIRRIVPIEAYGGSDFDSIEAGNTSAFNCRRVTGGSNWSRHAYGLAIDINPLENPYVLNGRTSHKDSRPFVNRRPLRPGMFGGRAPEVAVFEGRGWEWGGRWRSPKDYQHFSLAPR